MNLQVDFRKGVRFGVEVSDCSRKTGHHGFPPHVNSTSVLALKGASATVSLIRSSLDSGRCCRVPFFFYRRPKKGPHDLEKYLHGDPALGLGL